MTVTTFTSREFNQDTAAAKRAAARGPVVITDRGEPSHVLLSYRRYLELADESPDIVALLWSPAAAGIEFEPAKAGVESRAPDLG